MKLYKITSEETRRAVTYVMAPDLDTAREDAEELTAAMRDGDWDNVEVDSDVRACVPETAEFEAPLWTGGPDGEMVIVGTKYPEARRSAMRGLTNDG